MTCDDVLRFMCGRLSIWSSHLCSARPLEFEHASMAPAPPRWDSAGPRPTASSKTLHSCRWAAPPYAKLPLPRTTHFLVGLDLGRKWASLARPQGQTLHTQPWLHLCAATARRPRGCEFCVGSESKSGKRARRAYAQAWRTHHRSKGSDTWRT